LTLLHLLTWTSVLTDFLSWYLVVFYIHLL